MTAKNWSASSFAPPARRLRPCQYVHAGSFRASGVIFSMPVRTPDQSPARSEARTRHSSCSSVSAAPSAFANHSTARGSWFRAAWVASSPHTHAWSSGGRRSWSFFVQWLAATETSTSRLPREREEQELAVRAPLEVELVGALEELHRLRADRVELAILGLLVRRQVIEHALGRADLPRLQQETPALPDVARGELAGRDLALRDRHAALGQLARARPDAPELLDRRPVAAAPARLQAVAVHLRVIGYEVRERRVEELPLLPLAEDEQPLAAQLLGDERARVAAEEVADLARGGLLESQPQQPELGVWFEDVALERARVRREHRRVALGVGLARRKVVLLRRKPRLRVCSRCAQRHRESEAQGKNS